jgi:hypothetical protein
MCDIFRICNVVIFGHVCRVICRLTQATPKMGWTQLTQEVGLYKATVWLEPIPVNQLFSMKNY